MALVIQAAVEGVTDEAVLHRLVTHLGMTVENVYGKNGKSRLRRNIQGYNNAAHHCPWIVLVDLDHEADCAPSLRHAWLPDPAPQMCFRIAVRAVEAWLLADREKLASFLAIRQSWIPSNPEELADPKRTMVDLAQKSRRRAIQKDMTPRPGSGRVVGPAYTSRLIEFASQYWRPEVAAAHCDSLRRTMACLQRFLTTTSP